MSIWQGEQAIQAYEASQTYERHEELLANAFIKPPIHETFELLLMPGVTSPAMRTSSVASSITSSKMVLEGTSQSPAQLLKVIPIAQEQKQQGTTLTLVSLEVYSDGFVIQGQIFAENAPPTTPDHSLLPDIPSFLGSDDLGNFYRGDSKGGSGSQQHWRFSHIFKPALHSNAQELRLEIPKIIWQRFDWQRGERNQPRQRQIEREAGPWIFTINLLA